MLLSVLCVWWSGGGGEGTSWRTSIVLHAHHDLSFSIITYGSIWIDSTSRHSHERPRLPCQAREWLYANKATGKLQAAKKPFHSYGKQWEELSIRKQHRNSTLLHVKTLCTAELSSNFRFLLRCINHIATIFPPNLAEKMSSQHMGVQYENQLWS